jgi:hypothetical protein
VKDSAGAFTANERARIQETLLGLNFLLMPYNVHLREVDAADSGLANLVIDTGAASPAGGYADGLLGSFSNPGEILVIEGWNWYAGADAGQIGANQYDFQTLVTHELGHALGLGHSNDPGSAMSSKLASGVAHRTLTVQDLNIPGTGDSFNAPLGAVPTPAGSLDLFMATGYGRKAESDGGDFSWAGSSPKRLDVLAGSLFAPSTVPASVVAEVARLLVAGQPAPGLSQTPVAAWRPRTEDHLVVTSAEVRKPEALSWAELPSEDLAARDWVFGEKGTFMFIKWHNKSFFKI